MKTKLAAICLCMLMSAQAPLALAQTAQLSSNEAWALVKETSLGEKLEVKLKDGRKVKGEKVLVSDSELSLSIKNQQGAQIKRDEIKQVWRSLRPDRDKRRLYQGIGTGIGALGGLAIAIGASRETQSCGDCRGRAIGLTSAIVGLTIVGALIGRKLAGGKRMLIYQAP
jgi:hypothetical protein